MSTRLIIYNGFLHAKLVPPPPTPSSKLPKAKHPAEISQASMLNTQIGLSLESGC